MPYLLDANVFIEAKNLHYGFDFCPAFWKWLENNNDSGNVYSIEKVGDELIAGDDQLSEWARARGGSFFLPLKPGMINSLSSVSSWAMSQKYSQAAVNTFLQVADYYLVAHALTEKYIVVTREKPSNSINRVKIPEACISMGLKVMSPYEMLRVEKARFVLG